MLYKQQKRDSEAEYVFANPDTSKPYADVKRAFGTACKKAGIVGLRFHDLRHTFATRLVANGVDLITVRDLLGHSTVKMTERYTHLNQDQKKNAVELLVENEKKSAKLAHICHTEQNQESDNDVTDSLSIN